MKTSLTYVMCALIASARLALAQGTGLQPVHSISLTERRDIADAAVVNAAISVMVKDAASCPASAANAVQPCVCSFTNDLKKLKAAYDSAATRHPAWIEASAVVAYVDPANGKSVALNFPGLKRQLDACAGADVKRDR